MYDITTHGDFKKYYDKDLKKNYWVLGYFGGGPLNVVETYELAKQFATSVNVPLESVYIEEILVSSRFKYFKYIGSHIDYQSPESDSNITDNVMKWLHD